MGNKTHLSAAKSDGQQDMAAQQNMMIGQQNTVGQLSMVMSQQNMIEQQKMQSQSEASRPSEPSTSFQLNKLSSQENPFAPGGIFSLIKPNSLTSALLDFTDTANYYATGPLTEKAGVKNANNSNNAMYIENRNLIANSNVSTLESTPVSANATNPLMTPIDFSQPTQDSINVKNVVSKDVAVPVTNVANLSGKNDAADNDK